jgi:hypothetical protein
MQEQNSELPRQKDIDTEQIDQTQKKETQPNQDSEPVNQQAEDLQASSKQTQDPLTSAYFPDYQKPIPEEIVYQWQAPSRPFKKHKRQYFTTIATIVLLLCLILFFAGQFLPIAVVIAVAFLSYIMATIPPQTITNSITTYGVRNEAELYFWDELGRFWFEKKHNDDVLYIEVIRFPFRLALLTGQEPKEILTEIMSEILLNERPALTETERFAQWLQKKVPLDIDS